MVEEGGGDLGAAVPSDGASALAGEGGFQGGKASIFRSGVLRDFGASGEDKMHRVP